MMFNIVNNMNNSRKIGYLYLVIGILSIVGGLYITKSTYNFIENASSTEGVVLELVQRDDSLYPKIEFQDKTGESHIFEANSGCSPACYKEQEQVNILYVAGKNLNAKINSFMALWLPSLLLLGVGSAFVIVSLLQIKRLNNSAATNVT
jgi:hypothetical protein